MRAAFVTAAVAAPFPDEITSKGYMMPSTDTPRLLSFQDNKLSNQIVSALRPETATHTEENDTISVTSAQVGALGGAIIAYAATTGRSVKRNKVGSEDTSGSKPFHEAYQHYRQEVDRILAKNSTTATDAELDALVALMQAPSPTFDVHVGDIELHDVGEIIGAMSLHGKSINEIHQAFHSKDGTPLYLTDNEIDGAITAHFNNAISDDGAPWSAESGRRLY